LKISAVCQTKFGEPKFPISWQKKPAKEEWRGLVVGCTLAGMSPKLFVELRVDGTFFTHFTKNDG